MFVHELMKEAPDEIVPYGNEILMQLETHRCPYAMDPEFIK